MKTEETYPDLCICCGEPVPEGRMVCHACELGIGRANVPKRHKKTANALKALLTRKRGKKDGSGD